MSSTAASGCCWRSTDELLAIAEGQRPQEHAVDDAEDRGVGADAERHGEDHDESEPRIARHVAQAVTDILHECFPEPRQPRIAHVVFHAVDLTEVSERRGACFRRAHATADVVFREHVDVKRQFAIELAFVAFAPEQRCKAGFDSFQHGVPVEPGQLARMRATASERRSQFLVSSVSCFRPVRVSW